MSDYAETFVTEDWNEFLEEKLNKLFGEDKWRLVPLYQGATIPKEILIPVVNDEDEWLALVYAKNKFFHAGNGVEEWEDAEPESANVIPYDKLKITYSYSHCGSEGSDLGDEPCPKKYNGVSGVFQEDSYCSWCKKHGKVLFDIMETSDAFEADMDAQDSKWGKDKV